MALEEISLEAITAAILDIETNNFSNSESSHQVLVQSNLHFWRNCRLKNFKMAAMISLRNNLSNSESLYRSDASRKVSAKSHLRFWSRYRLKNFKMTAIMAIILDIGTEQF